jgi:hypothetical protein
VVVSLSSIMCGRHIFDWPAKMYRTLGRRCGKLWKIVNGSIR